jgi:hypothetical protein
MFKNLSILSTDSTTRNTVVADPTKEALQKIIEVSGQDFGITISADQNGTISFTK